MNKSVAAEYVEAVFNLGQVDRIADFVDADIQDHDAPPGLPPGIEGQKLKIAAFRAAFPDLKIDYAFQVEEADMVAGRFRLTGTQTGPFAGIDPTGRTVDVTGHDFLRFRGGKITDHWLCLDMASLMHQLQG